MFPSETVHHLLPAPETKGPKRILELLHLGLISLNATTSARSLICQTKLFKSLNQIANQSEVKA